MSWNFAGPNHFLYAAQRRLGFSATQVHRCAKDPELYRLNSIIAGSCEMFHRIRRERGPHGIHTAEYAAAHATLQEAEKNVQRLVMMALAAAEMVDDGYRGWGIEVPTRTFAILSDHDASPATVVTTADVATPTPTHTEELPPPPATDPVPSDPSPTTPADENPHLHRPKSRPSR